jgi:hypothetical protein
MRQIGFGSVLTINDFVARTSISETLSGPAVKVLRAIGHAPFAGRGSRGSERHRRERSLALERHGNDG